VNVTTRNPNDVNNFAFDAELINANGILPNNATAANIQVTTNGDAYYPAVVTLATELYAPKIVSTKTVTNLTGMLHIGGSQGSSNPTDALGDDAGEFNAGAGEVVFRLGVGGNGTTGGVIRPGDTDTATFA
jgi:hypothetical protein